MSTESFDDLTTQATKLAKEAFYVTVGLGVLAAREVNVRRLEVQKFFEGQVAGGKDQASRLASDLEAQMKFLDERLSAVEERIDAAMDQFQAALPEQARERVQQARDAAKSARDQVRNLIRVA